MSTFDEEVAEILEDLDNGVEGSEERLEDFHDEYLGGEDPDEGSA